MSPANLHFKPDHKNDPRPLVEIIAEQLGGIIRHVDKSGVRLYLIEDWVHVIMGNRSRDRKALWLRFKTELQSNNILLKSKVYVDTINVTLGNIEREADFTDEEGIYYITQHLPPNEDILSVRKYLAQAGVIVDTVRREPETGFDMARQAYRMQGKTEEWIDVRLEGKIRRQEFTDALKQAVIGTLQGWQYGQATNDIYLGLWSRTKEQLLSEMGLSKSAKLRDNQGTLALLYQSIAEAVCAEKLGNSEELTWDQAKRIVRTVADMIGKQAKETGEALGKDLATDNPLLPNSKKTKP